MKLLSPTEIQEKFGKLNHWIVIENSIQKKYSFKNFAESMAFVTRTALISEQMDHHPDILIQYNKVQLTLTTHSAHGLTDLDFILASKIDT